MRIFKFGNLIGLFCPETFENSWKSVLGKKNVNKN